ncbi:type I restriction-modification system specificity subunit S [Vibrio cholerae]|uniref:restriction endonuclease subunit S n=1 Tax=Vibrio cholerae TaxID=666 RepID=UPI0011DA70E3|nr:restriction endonuclease subunit S [Vibrio cholerae]TXY13084.1 restriction endonuclease subunit S [Vibrio cholerae]GHY02382.1 type I restriction-modification system specificity subunit S [Vibrio cholerae]
MSHYKPYPAYRDSGVEWIGQVPEHWRVTPLKVIAETVNGATPESGKPEYWDGDIAWYTPTDIDNEVASELGVPRRYITQAGYESCAVKLSPPGSVILSTRAPIGSVGITTIPSTINQGCRTLIPAQDVPTSYLASTLVAAREELRLRGNGTTFQELSTEALRSLRVPMPPRSECVSIASGLDRETARFDALIAKKTRFIELLKEKRQALITHAVTKGLDTNVPMRDSKSEWIGEVPEHWRVCSLGYLSRISTGGTPDRKNDSYWNGEIPWVKTGEINYKIISDTEERITDAGLSNSATFIAEPGTILMAMYGMGVTRGRVAVLGIPASFNQACAAISCSSGVHNWYVFYCLCAAYRFIRDLGNEASQVNLNLEIVSKIKVPVPPLLEQEEIEKHLVAQLQKLDAIEQRVSNSISLIKERRSAFITAAVTGQIDLRESA